jgi:hypothetical protein
LILRRSKALASGLAIPEQSLSVVLGNADAAIIVIRQGELRLRVSRSGGLAKRVEVSGRLAWVDIWTGACGRAAETRVNTKKAAIGAFARKLMEITPGRNFRE